MSSNDNYITYWCGIDVGKTSHHACIIDNDEKVVFSKAISQDESELRAIFNKYNTNSNLQVIVDQPKNIGSLVVAVAKDCGVNTVYLTALSMRRGAQLLSANTKTDKIDAEVIAQIAHGLPQTLRTIDDNKGGLYKDLELLSGRDSDLQKDKVAKVSRLRALFVSTYPSFERALKADRITSNAALSLLIKYGGPQGIKKARKSKVLAFCKVNKLRNSRKIVDDIFESIDEQMIVIPGSIMTERLAQRLAKEIKGIKEERQELEEMMSEMIKDLPQAKILLSIPGVGIHTAVKILFCIGDISNFSNAAQLASYAGLAPRIRKSGTSINSSTKSYSGNKILKYALVWSAMSALHCDKESRKYYDNKRLEGKHHYAALCALARRRCDVMFAMLRDGNLFISKHKSTEHVGLEVAA